MAARSAAAGLRRRGTVGSLWLVLPVFLLCTGAAFGLINPDFTPLHLTRQSEVIVHLQVQPPGGNGAMTGTVEEVVKGEFRQESLDLKAAEEFLLQRISEEIFYEEGMTAPALLFLGEPPEQDQSGARNGVFSLAGIWFSVRKDGPDAPWTVGEDFSDMKAVWDGRTTMLLRCVRYIMGNPDAEVPTEVGVGWGEKARIGQVEGTCTDILAVDFRNSGRPDLLVLSDSGDRLFRYQPDGGGFEDVTGASSLSSASQAATLADLTGDGRLDFVSWNGQSLKLHPQSAEGTFEGETVALPFRGKCLGLSPLETGSSAGTGLLISTDGAPVLLSPQDDATFSTTSLPREGGEESEAAGYGLARACAVADFDGDAVPDIVQPFEEGGLFYRGKGKGAFEPGRPCGYLYTGQGPVRVNTGDFDADGLLDLLFAGEMGHFIWLNNGEGQFENIWHIGEPDYIAKQDDSDAAVGDLNNDGRRDFVIFYNRVALHPFFSRGFAAFGFAAEMDVVKQDLFRAAASGQQTGLLADMNGDGAQDLATVLSDGTVWALFRETEHGPGLCAKVTLPPDAGHAGPVNVTGWEGNRCLGAWSVTPGVSRAFFGKQRPGPIKITWQMPDGRPQERQVILTRGPVSVELAGE